MSKDFIPYQEALELKELGFDEPCFGEYYYGKLKYDEVSNGQTAHNDLALAPTYSQVFRWFREKHSLDCYIDRGGAKGVYHAFVGGSEHGFLYGNNGNSPSEFTYEEAELECLIKLIEIAKDGK